MLPWTSKVVMNQVSLSSNTLHAHLQDGKQLQLLEMENEEQERLGKPAEGSGGCSFETFSQPVQLLLLLSFCLPNIGFLCRQEDALGGCSRSGLLDL